MATQYDNITIPCKPTSKTVEVELRKDGEKVNAPYDPTRGFEYHVTDLGDWQVKCYARTNESFFLLYTPTRM